jgi:hypothetical protein
MNQGWVVPPELGKSDLIDVSPTGVTIVQAALPAPAPKAPPPRRRRKTQAHPSPKADALIDWYDGLPPKTRKGTANHLADLYLKDDPTRGVSHRYAVKVFQNKIRRGKVK